MCDRVRPYTGTKDAPAGRTQPGTTELYRLAAKRWGMTNKGTYNNRPILSGPSKGKPSVHGTGRAIDLGYTSRLKGIALWDFLLANSRQLGIEAIHDYAYDPDGGGPKKGYGRTYRCNRGEGWAGVRIGTAKNNAGWGGKWIHVELSPAMAKDRAKFRRAWIAALRRSGLK